MSNRNRHNDAATTAGTVEWMFVQLLSDEPLEEQELDGIRAYLVEAGDEHIKETALQRALVDALRSGREIYHTDHSQSIWQRLVHTLGFEKQEVQPRMELSLEQGAGQGREWSGSGRQQRRSTWRRIGLRAAAVLIPAILIIGGLTLWNPRIDGLFAPKSHIMVAEGFVPATTVVAAIDSVRHVTMPDGTRVVLNRNSTLEYNDKRESRLKGEAWFEVAKNPEKPFVVHSDYVRVTVPGTRFNFNTRSEEDVRSVLSLYEGVVQLDHSKGRSMLEAGGKEFLVEHAAGSGGLHDFTVRDFDKSKLPAWLDGDPTISRNRGAEMLMQILTLDEIFAIVEQEYGVEIAGKENVELGRRYNFMLNENGSLSGVMAALRYANGKFNYTISGSTVQLSKNTSK